VISTLLRSLRVVWMAFTHPRIAPLELARIDFVCTLDDLDVNLHMNNARYLVIMDHGRWDYTFRSGLGRLVLTERYMPIIGSAMIRFRRSLTLFDRFTLTTRLMGWDDKWSYIEHRIAKGEDVYCVGIMKTLFKDRHGPIPSATLAAKIGHTGASPALPDWVLEWQAAEAKQFQKPGVPT